MEEPLMREIRYLDKPVNKLASGKPKELRIFHHRQLKHTAKEHKKISHYS